MSIKIDKDISFNDTVHFSSFHVPGRILTSQGKHYSTNTEYMRQNGTVR